MATRFFGGDNLSAIGIITALGLALSSFLFNDGQTRLANVDVTGQTPIANMQFGGYAVAARFHATSTASEWGVCQTSGGTSSTPTGINCYRPFEDSMFSMYAVSTTDGIPYPMMFQTPPWFTADYISFGYGLAGATGTHIAGGIFPFDDGENDVGFPGFNFRNGYFSSDVIVAGQSVCLEDGTNCPAGSGTPNLQQVLAQGNTATTSASFFGGITVGTSLTATGTFAVTGSATSTFAGTVSSTALFSTNGNITNLRFTGATGTDLAVTRTLLMPEGTLSQPGARFGAFPSSGIGAYPGNLLFFESGVLSLVLSDVLKEFRVPSTYSYSWSSAGDNLAAADTFLTRSGPGIISTNGSFRTGGSISSTNASVTGTVSVTSDVVVNGQSVCLEDGTNCPASGGGTITSSTWQFNQSLGLIYPTTSTFAMVLGASASATAPFYWETRSPTSSLQIGRVGNANLFVGTSTYGGGLNAAFSLNGDDAFIQSNLGVLGIGYFGTATATSMFGNAGTFGTLTSNSATLGGGTINAMAIGGTTPSTGAFTGITLGTSDLLPTTNNGGQDIGSTSLVFSNGYFQNLNVRNIRELNGSTASSTLTLSGRSGEIDTSSVPRPTSTLLVVGGVPRTLPAMNATSTNCIYWGPEFIRDAWDGLQLKPTISWTNATGSGAVVWRLRVQSIPDGTSIGTAWTGTSSYATGTVSTAFLNQNDSMNALTVGAAATGTPMRFELCRNAAQAGDTFGADAYPNSLKIEYGLGQYSD